MTRPDRERRAELDDVRQVSRSRLGFSFAIAPIVLAHRTHVVPTCQAGERGLLDKIATGAAISAICIGLALIAFIFIRAFVSW